jgi:hypothetical protein
VIAAVDELNELIDELTDEELTAFILYLRSLTGEKQ